MSAVLCSSACLPRRADQQRFCGVGLLVPSTARDHTARQLALRERSTTTHPDSHRMTKHFTCQRACVGVVVGDHSPAIARSLRAPHYALRGDAPWVRWCEFVHRAESSSVPPYREKGYQPSVSKTVKKISSCSSRRNVVWTRYYGQVPTCSLCFC